MALIRDGLLARRRSFRRDAVDCVGTIRPPLQVFGRENIPLRGPCVITVNHYYRPGFAAQWFALAIAAAVPVEMHWAMTGELTFPGKWYASPGRAVSKWILARGARIYGFTTMPPMPPREADVEARARSVREVLGVMRREQPILGFAPEGGDQPGGKLAMPVSGAGRLGLLLAGLGCAFEPVAAYETDGVFCLGFGQPYQLNVPPNLSTDEKDRTAARIMMEHIAALLPTELRGEFA